MSHSVALSRLTQSISPLYLPQVLCMGTQSVFIDNANEQHHMILLKHFTEKNHAAVVDVKTRKRKTGERREGEEPESLPFWMIHTMRQNLLSLII